MVKKLSICVVRLRGYIINQDQSAHKIIICQEVMFYCTIRVNMGTKRIESKACI